MWRREYALMAMLTLTACFALVSSAAAGVIYVDDDANGANNGSSWQDAYRCLQNALEIAKSGDEIRVAQGVYRPDQRTTGTSQSRLGIKVEASGNRIATFQLKSGVTLRGGYAGLGTMEPDARDIRAYTALLSGDLRGNDIQVDDPCDLGMEISRADNSYHVATGSGADTTAVLDGFTITGGNASEDHPSPHGDGAGMYSEGGSPEVTNCTFSGNSAYGAGGGMYNRAGRPTVSCCYFIENFANGSGGAMAILNSDPVLTDCIFTRNVANGGGGAIYGGGASPTIMKCMFAGNCTSLTYSNGGAVHVGDGDPVLTNCAFTGNMAADGGGLSTFFSNPCLTNCTFSGNHAQYAGGGIWGGGQVNLTLINCILWGNTDASGDRAPAQVETEVGGVTVNHSCIQGWTEFFGGTGNHGLDPGFADADGPDHLFGTEDDDLSLLEGSPCIDAGDRTAVPGSIATDLAGDPRIVGDAVDLGAYEHHSPGIPALPTRPPRVMYVDDDATVGGTDGSSWENAYGCLHDALRIAVHGDEIRVAQGVYRPDRGTGIELGDREATFQLADGVALIGGYAGLPAPDPNARDHQLYRSVLSGDLAANDVGMDNSWHSLSSSFGENSFHVITCGSVDESTVLDGFTVTGGNNREHSALYGSSYNRGGGMYIGRGTPRIIACTFRANLGDSGAALAMSGGSPTIVDCTFVDNVSWSHGGGIFSSNGSPMLSRCTFTGNNAISQIARGGAIYAENGRPVVANCIFVGNLASRGGGLFNSSGCSAHLANCLFNANSGYKGGGLYISGGKPIIVNSTFSGNKTEWGGNEGFGGGIYSEDNVSATLVNCILWGNTDCGGSGEPAQIVGGSPTLNHCVVQAWTGVLSGTATHGADPLFVDADGADDVVGTEDDNLRLLGGSPCLDAGDQTALAPEIGTDLDGSPRTVNGTVDLGAYEGPHQGFLLSTRSVEIVEGGTAVFTIALAMDPLGPVEVMVGIESGDSDITIRSSRVLAFDSQDYWRPQSVVVTAAEDADYLPGSAMIAITAEGFATSRLAVTEDDTDELEVVYVDARARGVNDGTCWEDAFVDLQDALQVAMENPAVEEVRVAQGVYCPTGPEEGSRGDLRLDRDATFQLVNGVAIRGGYAGWREPEPDARDIQLYETILSGDLNHDDGPILDPCDLLRDPSRTDNCMHVVTSERTDPTTVLDGFTIADGNASGARGREGGGGMRNFEGDPTILNCTFVRNSARINGGAVRSVSGSPTLLNCVFRDNASFSEGGGVYTVNDSPILVGCRFVHNSVFGLSAEGGGMYSESDTVLINCAFNGNTAEVGGGMYSSGSRLFNCVFTGNTAVSGGGIGIAVGAGHFVLENCTFVGNSAQDGSAMAYGHPAHPLLPFWEDGLDPGWKSVKLINSILWDGENQIYSTIGEQAFSSIYGNVQGGWAGEGNIDLDPAFVDADGADDLFGTEDDNPRLRSGSPCIDAGSNETDAEADAFGANLLVGADADLQIRRVDDPGTVDTGLGRSSIVDMGAYEFGSSPVPSVLRVNDDAEGANTGASWNDAFADLQCALLTAFVAPEKVDQIWVAAGVYTPARPGGRRSATFSLTNGLGIYGGFAGGETSLDQRDVTQNIAILSGDLCGNDVLDHRGRAYFNTDDNCYHVVVASYTNATSVLDGFTISSGNADPSDPLLSDTVNGRGAGVYIASGRPQIRNCVVTRNTARVGAGIWCERAGPTFVDCVVANNSAGERGGGSYCYEASPVLERCTIKANTAEQGAGTYCDRSTPSFVGCMFNGNQAASQGGGCLGVGGEIRLTDCTFSKNQVDAASIADALVDIEGVVQMASNDFTGNHAVLTGDGTLRMAADVTLNLNNSAIRCNVSGPGLVQVDLGSELTVGEDALIDLGAENDPNGRILCHGLLRVKDEAIVSNAQVRVTRASFEDDAIIANCVFEAEAGAPYGQFFIEDNVQLWLDGITADGDRYLDLDPRVFDCNSIHVDAIDVHVTEGIGGTHGGLFELRGRELTAPPCGPDELLCQVEKVPDFGPDTWTLARLELVEGAKLNLTNRFDFQAPYDAGGESEVLYVRELVLGPDSVLNTAFNRLYYETLIVAPTAEVVHVPLLGFSLNNITFDDENDFFTRVTHNNHLDVDEQPPDTTRIHVERVLGHELDPNGVMRMCNLRDIDPDSPTRGQTIRARAKGLFAKSSEDEILIRFEYLFSDPAGEGELVIYLSDTPEMLDHSDPLRELHYLDVARLPHPPAGRPGSAGSGMWGVFERVVSRGSLDFIRGTRIEFELMGPEGTGLVINNWDPAVRCTMTCGDVAGAYHQVDAVDFLAVMSECGRRTDDIRTPGAFGAWCLEGFFCDDGYVTTDDALAIDWIGRKNLCPDELVAADLGPFASASAVEAMPSAWTAGVSATGVATRLDGLQGEFLVAGKRYEPYEDDSDNFPSDRLYDMGRYVSDRLYAVDRYGKLVNGPFDLERNRLNGKLVRDPEGTLYQLNLEYGLVRIADHTVVLGPTALHVESEPRYGELATIYVGFQQQGEDSWGRPLLDAALDQRGYAYVVPVVVAPVIGSPYLAAAKLAIGQDPSTCTVLQLFDHVPIPNDNQTVDQLREIEVDPAGNVYVLNCHCNNNSDILWAYSSDGQRLARRELGELGVDAPVGLCVSAYDTSRLYLSSSRNRPDSVGVKIYVLSTDELVLSEVVEVQNMGHVTGIAENPLDGTLCVVGFAMPTIPTQSEIQDAKAILDVNPFYEPRIAIISYGTTGILEAVDPSDISAHCDLALPLSVMWTGLTEDTVSLGQLAADWLEPAVTSSLW